MVKFGGASPARSGASSTRRCASRSMPTAAPATASPARPRSFAPAASASSPTRTPLYTLSPLGRGQGEGSVNVLLTRDGPIATVTLNRPDRRNSLSDDMLTELGVAFAELRDDAETRVVIVTGAPPVFSAGADAGHAKAATPEERRRLFLSRKSQFRRLFERSNALLENLEQATIAAVNGHAVGGGWGLALACDFRIAAAEAQFWIPEVDLGVPLGVGTTTRFVRMLGPARAKEVIMGCARYSAADTQAWGLVNRVVPGAELAQAARDYAHLLAKKPFRPLAEAKARINAIARTGIPEVNAMTEGFLDRE